MFIDIHVHVQSFEGPPLHGKPRFASPEHLIERYNALKIEKGVLLPDVAPECNWIIQGTEEILAVCKAYPDRFIPFCNVDPRQASNSVDAPLGELLTWYRQHGCKGIGEISANLPFLHPMVQNLFRHAQELDLPVTFHISPEIGNNYGLYDDPGLPQLERCLAKFPRLKFFGHSQAFWAEIAPLSSPGARWAYPNEPVAQEGVLPKLFRRYPNLYGDLSAGSGHNALARDPEYALQFLDEFQDRLFFGTDICAPDTPTPLVDFLLDLHHSGKLTEEVFQKIARENAIRVLALE